MTIQRQTPTGRHEYDRESALAWLAPRHRAELAQLPPEQRRATIALARQRAAERPRSYLAEHLTKLYGEG